MEWFVPVCLDVRGVVFEVHAQCVCVCVCVIIIIIIMRCLSTVTMNPFLSSDRNKIMRTTVHTINSPKLKIYISKIILKALLKTFYFILTIS